LTKSKGSGLPVAGTREVDIDPVENAPANQQGNGGVPRALAAFFQRPQAACSNRRYISSLEEPRLDVN
jgi:hypothetical protein